MTLLYADNHPSLIPPRVFLHSCSADGGMDGSIERRHRLQYPREYEAYQRLCRLHSLEPGDVSIHRAKAQIICNIVTKATSTEAVHRPSLSLALEKLIEWADGEDIQTAYLLQTSFTRSIQEWHGILGVLQQELEMAALTVWVVEPPVRFPLTVDIVPTSCWDDNLSPLIGKQAWHHLKIRSYQRARYVCTVCGQRGWRWPVESHLVWDYDDIHRVQTLVDIQALCPLCHHATHLTENDAYPLPLIRQKLIDINNWDEADLRAHIENRQEIARLRSSRQWILNLSLLEGKRHVPPLSEVETKAATKMSSATTRRVALHPSLV